MMLIGTSLGGCLKSMISGEVSEADVLTIISRTACPNHETLDEVVESYYNIGNLMATKSDNYELKGASLGEVKALARRLYDSGKIHQPRLISTLSHFIHPELNHNRIWLNVEPVYTGDNHAVVEAYSKYRMLATLVE